MDSVAQVSLGGVWVDAHRAIHSSKHIIPACRAKKMMLDIRFRVSKLEPQEALSHVQAVSHRDPEYWRPPSRILHINGFLKDVIYLNRVASTRLERRLSSLSPRAQMPGDLSLVSETLREVGQGDTLLKQGILEATEVEDGVVLGYGWKVRDASRFDTEELRAVAHIQASSFHLQAAVFDELFFKLFKAEILSALIYKARQSPPERYACLLAEPATELKEEMSNVEPTLTVVGAVNLTAAVDNEVLRHLHSAIEYLYVSGMAVDVNYRRQNVATLLLKACDLRAMEWGFDYLVLHAYEEDMAARTLYSRAGYRVIALDPLWMSTWVGRKRRVLMAKRTSRTPSSY